MAWPGCRVLLRFNLPSVVLSFLVRVETVSCRCPDPIDLDELCHVTQLAAVLIERNTRSDVMTYRSCGFRVSMMSRN
jgi:hypothetical protein